MICTPAQRAQTPQDVACFITTDPPELGDRDVAFQANVTVTGFDPDADLTYLWDFGAIGEGEGEVFAEGQNPTIAWRNTMFSPGYYTLGAIVTDGGFVALCDQHFTIGDMPPNNPPECLDVIVVPLPPPAGSPVLGARVVARDADGDPLDYSFGLMRGFGTEIFSPGPWYPDTYVFGVPGGLQPGPYTVAVLVSDGNFLTWCSFHFVVPDFVGGESAECGPVGILYLDDYDVEMNQLAIDAAIEAALAEGGPEYSVIVSHRQALIDKFGQEGFEQIDALLNNMRSIAETCPFVLIVGDHDVVPFAVLPNPANDGDVLFTDDIYGDNDHDDLTAPDIPVARIPDGGSLDLLLTQLSASDAPEGGDFSLAAPHFPHSDPLTQRVFGPERSILWSPPTRYTNVDPSRVNTRYDYFMLHGSNEETRAWWGDDGTEQPVAFTLREADSQGVVASGACYGAYAFDRMPETSISLAFLDSGARAFVGSTGISYWYVRPREILLTRGGGLFMNTYLGALTEGEAPLAAFMKAKEQMASLARSGNAHVSEVKMLHGFVYYGKP